MCHMTHHIVQNCMGNLMDIIVTLDEVAWGLKSSLGVKYTQVRYYSPKSAYGHSYSSNLYADFLQRINFALLQSFRTIAVTVAQGLNVRKVRNSTTIWTFYHSYYS